MDATTDALILVIVIAARLGVPLLIPWYPLPGVVAALILDAVDQTIFQSFTTLDLAGYQGYDKALDIYYLSIAYVATLRNWSNLFAFRVSRLLFYYRLAGVVLFELTGWRLLLFIFPNTFEYFFIWYEIVALLRDPRRLPRATVAGAAAAIWIIIKLPQEFWLHIARLDLTDVLKTALFGAPPETTWGHLFQAVPGMFIAAVVAGSGLIVALALAAARRQPRRLVLSARGRTAALGRDAMLRARGLWSAEVFDRDLAEKVIFLTLLVVIFAQVLPNTRATTLQVAAGAVIIIVLNAGLSHWLARRGIGWRNAFAQFLVMAATNITIVAAFQLIPGSQDLDDAAAAFYVLLLSLIITLFDRFTIVQNARFPRREMHRSGE